MWLSWTDLLISLWPSDLIIWTLIGTRVKLLTLEGKDRERQRKEEEKMKRRKRENQSQLLHSLVSLYAHFDLIIGSDLRRVQWEVSLWSCFFHYRKQTCKVVISLWKIYRLKLDSCLNYSQLQTVSISLLKNNNNTGHVVIQSLTKKGAVKLRKNNEQIKWVVSCDGEKRLHVIMSMQRGHFETTVAINGKSQLLGIR